VLRLIQIARTFEESGAFLPGLSIIWTPFRGVRPKEQPMIEDGVEEFA
jgi:hypothetical protein